MDGSEAKTLKAYQGNFEEWGLRRSTRSLLDSYFQAFMVKHDNWKATKIK